MKTRYGLTIGALFLALAATGAANAQHLRVGLQEDPDVLDPHRARTYVGRIVFTSLCDKLIDINPKLEFVPQLATSWSWSDDNKTLTFKLRDDVTFHDGTRFDGAAAAANIERARTLPESLRKSELSSVEKAEAPDATTLVLTLKQPDATLLAQLSDRAGMMLSPKAFGTGDMADFGRAPVCSGPYKFASRVQNDRIVLDKFAEHRDAAKYHFERISYLPIPDTTVRLANLRAGDIDILERMNPSDAAQVKGDANLQFEPVAGLGWLRLTFNTNNGDRAKGPMGTDKRVRQAFQLALDREVINEVVGGGIFDPAQQPFPPASPFYSDKFPLVKRDVAKARALLKEAGHDRVRVEFLFGNNTTSAAIAEMIQAMVAEAGFDLALRPTEFAAMQKEAQGGNFDIMMIGWSGRVDPDGNIHTFVTCKGALNDGRYCNPAVDKLLDEARTVPATEPRKALYDQAQVVLQDELPAMYVYYQPWPFALGKKVQGFTPYPDGMIRLKDVTLAK